MHLTRSRWSLALATAALHLLAAGAQAQSGSVASLSAQTDIFKAGGNSPGLDGLTPSAIALTAGTGRTLTLSGVTGSVGCAGSTGFTADGVNSSNQPCVNPAIVNASGSISGVSFLADATTTNGRSIALVGLFLGNSLPGSAPTSLVYGGGAGQLSYSLTSYSAFALGQVFYIGDGLTGTQGAGTQQSFAVPDGATRLFFGFVDAPNYQGDPGAYSGDNVGSLSFNYSVAAAPTSTVPEPATLALVGGGLALVGAAARRRRRSA